LRYAVPRQRRRERKSFGSVISPARAPRPIKHLYKGLRDLGYVDAKNIGIIFRTTEGRRERYSDLAVEIVRLKVDVIVTDGTPGVLALKTATSTIPIVMTGITDPVRTGLVASLARPGGNITGLTNVTGELGGKLLELLKETVPRLSRAAILMPEGIANDLFVREMEVPARALGIELMPIALRGPDHIEEAFRAITKDRANGLIMRLPTSFYSAHFKRVAELTIKNHLPAITTARLWVEAGGLMSYGPNLGMSWHRVATYVDKILKGAKPTDLPVEAPTKFELRINLKTAKQIGLTIPPNVLARADRVIR
jgi:ABC-type uncharacterized transport system substrate-binding protein